MTVYNADIADVFEAIAEILETQRANPFRIRAYRNGARTVRALEEEVRDLIAEGKDLTELPGIGKDLAGKLQEIVATGSCATLETLRSEVPPGLVELLRIPGLGPKRVNALYYEAGIQSPAQLLQAAKSGRLHQLPGFGTKSEANVIEAVESHIVQKQRYTLALAAQRAEPLVEHLRGVAGVDSVEIAGSFRRCRETVGDIDILACARDGDKVIQAFVDYEDVITVLSKGPTRSSVILRSGIQADLRVVKKQSCGAALYYLTGSKAHSIAIRQLAQKHGLKVNEYGVFKSGKRLAGSTEQSVLRALGLPWIAPELRENNGEIEAALNGELPVLVETGDLQGDLHAHTTATDGANSLEEMAQAARKFGLSYLAITEHSRHLTIAHGLDQRRLLQQIEAIDALNATLDGITILKSIEVDILEDGALDMDDATLARLDLVVGAVHSHFRLSREKQTERILRAMENEYFNLLAHPTGRLLSSREAYDVDMARIIRQARQCGCYLELNAQTERLDLTVLHCQMAKAEGVLVSINSDAHSINGFSNLKYGVGQARRGWLEKQDILNTRSLQSLRKLLAR